MKVNYKVLELWLTNVINKLVNNKVFELFSMKSKDQNPQTSKKNKCYRDHKPNIKPDLKLKLMIT